MANVTARFNDVEIQPGTSATLKLYEDTTGDGNIDNQDIVSLSDGVTEYTLSGFDDIDGNDTWYDIELANPSDLTNAAKVTVDIELEM